MSSHENDIDSCAWCGLPDVLDGDNATAHWKAPFSSLIVAWTCSDSCADELELHRSEEGVLVPPDGPGGAGVV